MPTILINTNLNNKIRYKDKNETTTPVNNDTTTTAEAAAATSSGDGGSSSTSTSTSNDGGEANSDASYDMDAEFRKDLNTIITKLLNKSQTVSFFFFFFFRLLVFYFHDKYTFKSICWVKVRHCSGIKQNDSGIFLVEIVSCYFFVNNIVRG